jgi:hypothetical protein
VLSPLAVAYQRRLATLSRTAAGAIAVTWDSAEGLDDAAAERFAVSAAPVGLAAQRTAVYLADGYLAAYLRQPPQALDPDDFSGPAIRNGADPRDVWKRSVVTARAAIARGRDYADARGEGRARAMATARTDVALSARAVTTVVLTRSPGVTGYRRVLGAEPCKLCVTAAAKTYRSEVLMPLHGGCSCGVAPVIGTEDTETVPESEVEIKVVEHDELGPMLWQADHDFAELH